MYGLVEASLLGCPIVLPPHFGMMKVRINHTTIFISLVSSAGTFSLVVDTMPLFRPRQNFFFAGANKHVCAECIGFVRGFGHQKVLKLCHSTFFDVNYKVVKMCVVCVGREFKGGDMG